ncbi:multiple sugar transport system permease protein [Kineococcus xinjiangensis]|uniref:Multiple sugar transport system permease protein n=1 Tax=Kineococcus xinjiangensis TaxID=512762 RepID=A0A2S6IWF3_9ACTN|nr:sugar ABC transporter permease [Kineococcus xinjiangensis]PPK98687.1 multiple sugar transport system permease protein [Kineococcus xinjiangensis]
MSVAVAPQQPSATERPAARLRAGRSRQDLVPALLFLLPAAFGFVTFYAWPALRTFYLSFTDYSLLAPPEWVGVQNYAEVLGDRRFWKSLTVTLEYVVINIGVQTVVALALAVLMHRLTKSTLIRGVLLLPYLVANVVVALVWYTMLDAQLGIVNSGLELVGLDPVAFFGETSTAIPTIALVNVWRHMGYTALLIFAGLQSIPSSVYEAAAIDGASEWRIFWRITMPLLRPVLVLVLVLTVIGSFQIFDTVAVTTKGGPIDSTRVIYYYIYEKAFQQFDFGYAAALCVVLFVILAGVALAQVKILRAGDSDLD